MLKQSVGSCQRSPVAGRGSPKSSASTAAAGSHLGSPAAVAKRTLWPQHQPTSPASRSFLPPGALSATVEGARVNGNANASSGAHSNGAKYGNGHVNGAAKANGHSSNGHSRGAASDIGLHDSVLVRDGSTVRMHLVVPRCTTMPGEYLLMVGDCEALGNWDVKKGLRLDWCSGHMHTATFALPADSQPLRAKLVMVRTDLDHLTWETGNDRLLSLRAPGDADSKAATGSGSSKGLRAGNNATPSPLRTPAVHDYVVVCHWGHTDATSVLAQEVPGDLLMLEQQLSDALVELRTARTAASTSQEKLSRLAQDMASSERAARQSAEQLTELQARHDAMAIELAESKRQAKAAVSAATEAAAAAAQASSVTAAEVEARVSQRYAGRMAELQQQLDGVKSQYSLEVSAMQEKLEAGLSKELEAQEMVKTLREIVQKDVARLRTELSQLVNEYIAARQQLQEQAQQIEASEKLRMQQIDGLSTEIKSLITKYNNAQSTIADQQRLLEDLHASRGGVLPRGADPVPQLTAPPGPDPQAGRDWRSDWARLRKLSANGAAAPTQTSAAAGAR